jgi:hypothetical protein
MKLCTGCFWHNKRDIGDYCMHDSATRKSLVDGSRRQVACDTMRMGDCDASSCGKEGGHWTDKDCDVCSVCQEPLDPADAVGDDGDKHLNCAVGQAESRSEGDR